MVDSLSQSQPASEGLEGATALVEWELATIELFVHAAQLIGIPKSMGQIYGLLFCSDKPLHMDAIVTRLGISKGSASQGLKTLRQIGAIHNVFQPGDRRDHYAAELKLRRLVSGFLTNELRPHLESGTRRLEHIEELSKQDDARGQALADERLAILRTWHGKTSKLLPLVQKIL